MRSSHSTVIIWGAALLVMILFVFVIAVPLGVVRSRLVWYRAGATFSLTFLVAGGVWYWLDRPLEFHETVGVAAVVAVGVAAVSTLDPSGFPPWLQFLSVLQFTVPTAFMLPLGATTSWRQRLVIGAVVLFPMTAYLLYWPVFQPDGFGTLASLVSMVGGWLVFSTAVGVPLVAVGHRLADGDSVLRRVSRQSGTRGPG